MTTHDTHMDTQQLMKTIEEQNQVIIAKDKYIEELQYKLKKTSGELYDLQWKVSEKIYHQEWATEAMKQKSVKIIGGFEYNTRYIPLHLCITLNIAIIAFGLFILSTMGAFK